MRGLLARVIQRVMLSERLTPHVTPGAEMSTHGHRRLVVGLGNPGMEGSRHSVGMAVLGVLAARLGVSDRWRGDKHVSGEVIVSEVDRTQVVLLRPRVLMNLNGVCVAKAAKKFGVRPEDILTVHDDMDKGLGKIAVKSGGSARGHNGVRSCIQCLHSDGFSRLRVGIGRPPEGTSVERFVLGRFSGEEQKVLDPVLVQSVDLILSRLRPQQETSTSTQSPPAGGRRAAQKRRREEKEEQQEKEEEKEKEKEEEKQEEAR